jgi:hypothetical protein
MARPRESAGSQNSEAAQRCKSRRRGAGRRRRGREKGDQNLGAVAEETDIRGLPPRLSLELIDHLRQLARVSWVDGEGPLSNVRSEKGRNLLHRVPLTGRDLRLHVVDHLLDDPELAVKEKLPLTAPLPPQGRRPARVRNRAQVLGAGDERVH